MTSPLASCLVVDFTTLLPGPLATLMLAEAGAEVVKIERPGGEDMRRFAPVIDDQSVPFALLNRGKKAVALDLKDHRQRQRLMPLLERADIVVEQFRPGVMARLGLDYETLRRRNPRLIYCSITGYGSDGPLAGKAGHDLNYIAEAGLLSLSHGTSTAPVLPPALIADIAGGSLPAVINILLALLGRNASGQGAHVDVAMSRSLFAFMPFALADLAAGRAPAAPGQGILTGGLARYNLYPAKDGGLIAIAALEEQFWAEVCKRTGLETRFHDDYRTPQESHARLSAIIVEKPAKLWTVIFADADCCVSAVTSLEDALRNPQFSPMFVAGQGIATRLPLPIDRGFSCNLAPIAGAGADNHLYLDKDFEA